MLRISAKVCHWNPQNSEILSPLEPLLQALQRKRIQLWWGQIQIHREGMMMYISCNKSGHGQEFCPEKDHREVSNNWSKEDHWKGVPALGGSRIEWGCSRRNGRSQYILVALLKISFSYQAVSTFNRQQSSCNCPPHHWVLALLISCTAWESGMGEC